MIALLKEFYLLDNVLKRLLQIGVLALTLSLCYWSACPFLGELYSASGDAYVNNKKPYIALGYYLKGLSYDSLNPKLYQKAGLLYLDLSRIEKNPEYMEEGIALLLKAVPLTGKPSLDYSLGTAFESMKESEKAQFYFQRAFERSGGTVAKNKIKNK